MSDQKGVPIVEIDPIVKGEDWQWEFRYVDFKKILSSTNDTPALLVVTDHGLDTGAIVFVANHLINTNVNTDTGVPITKISANQYTLDGVVGNGIGGRSGVAGAAIDLSDGDILCEFRTAPGGELIATPEIDTAHLDEGLITLSLASAVTKAIAVNSCTADIWRVKAGNNYPIATLLIPFARSVTEL